MKIRVAQISSEGITLEESIPAKELDLETEDILFCSPVKVKAFITRITNALTVSVSLSARIALNCSRCLEGFEQDFYKDLKLNYQVERPDQIIELNPDIREEIILDYPLKPLCKPDCKGLCPRCGQNLNEGGCTCGTT